MLLFFFSGVTTPGQSARLSVEKLIIQQLLFSSFTLQAEPAKKSVAVYFLLYNHKKTPWLEGSGSSVELNGEAKAELKGLLKKLARKGHGLVLKGIVRRCPEDIFKLVDLGHLVTVRLTFRKSMDFFLFRHFSLIPPSFFRYSISVLY
ncbi:MAG: hypothetical protein D3906_01775 [Candidatus Electrothrix sp. AUS1_2]|nr:hypothetical protein [Candidatus Electrothrix sp. AUS1_2]